MKMNTTLARLRARKVDLRAAVVAGMAGGAAYVGTMAVDRPLTGLDNDDLKLLGRPLVKGPEHARLAGVPVHAVNSAMLAVVYAALGHDRLPGPPWLRGAIFATIENTLLYPLTALEQHHPGIRNGEIDRYFSFKAYVQSTPRHWVYGAVVGTVYEMLRR